MRRVRPLLIPGALVLSAVGLAAQQPAPTERPVFRASTDLVTIDAVVTDGSGKPVTDLTRAKQRLAQTGDPRDAAAVFYNSGILGD